MKINYLKINNFGKIKNKEINFNNNINLIYGKNESGKTSLLKFIIGMFYGISKNKNGKDISDIEKYTPWNKEEFSGKIKYGLDNKENYEIFRDFSKKGSCKIYNDKVEDISNKFSIDKNKQNQFFYEQTKIEESLFLSTTVVEQDNTVLDSNSQSNLTQKIANILSSGEDSISYKKVTDKLNKKLIQEIGTERTQGRPLNIINEEINTLENKINLLNESKLNKDNFKDEISSKKQEISLLENELNLLKEIKVEKESEKLELERIKINNSIKNEEEEKLRFLKNKNKESNISKNNKNKFNKINLVLILILVILNIVVNILKINKTINYSILVITSIYIIFTIIKYLINKNKQIKSDSKLNIEKIKINNEINLLEGNIKDKELEIKNINKSIEENKNNKLNKIKAKYDDLLNENEVINLFNKNLDEVNSEIEYIERNLNKSKLELNTLYIEEKSLNEKLEEYSSLEERLQYLYSEKEELKDLEKILNLVKKSLEKSYLKMKENVTPKFTKNLSELVENISGGKYKKVKFNSDEGLIVELENGEYINASRLSIGTIDQLYLSLRLSSMREISEEKMPIILDETFAYYDNSRLENILKYLNENYKENQIIIFTCNDREKEIMNKLNIKYNLIEL